MKMKRTKEQNSLLRLNKFIAACGVCSRRDADELIQQGRVTVNGETVFELGFKIDEEKDSVKVDDKILKQKKHIYILMNKPGGVVCTTEDEKKRRTVTDLISGNERIFPVGRLDYNTTGVLFLTNDGEFTNFLLHPSHKIPREYEVTLVSELQDEHFKLMTKGVFIDGKRGKFDSIRFTSDTRKKILVSCHEGRNHFVKNMFSQLGYTMKKLNRKSYAGFNVRDIEPGGYKILNKKEIEKIYEKYS